MTTTLTLDDLESARGNTVYSTDGEKIGKVEELYVDEGTGRPEWIGIGTGFLGTKRVLVPVEGASRREGGVLVPYEKDHVKATPDTDSDEISQESERALYAHYGLEYSHAPSDTGLPEGRANTGPEEGALDTGLGASTHAPDSPGDAEGGRPAVTRSEEELRVGKRGIETGRLHLHKWTESEQVEVPVELRREKARVTREPLDKTVSGDEIGDEELEITLMEEQPVVQKDTVAKERIGIETEVETERQTVSEDVRKERVAIEGADEAR